MSIARRFAARSLQPDLAWRDLTPRRGRLASDAAELVTMGIIDTGPLQLA
jgi:hypothetical protein